MGYWEQIGSDNRRELERRRSLPKWRQIDWMGVAAVPLSAIIYLIMGAAVLKLFHLL